MNIALICSDRGPCPPIKGGAIQLYIAKVVPLLATKHDVTVISISDPQLPEIERQENVQYIRFNQETFWQDVLHLLQNTFFDILHIFNRPQQISSIKKASPRSKVLLSLHNIIFGREWFSDQQAHDCLKHVDYITTVSQFLKTHLLSRYSFPNHLIRPLYSGVDIRDYPRRDDPLYKEQRKTVRKRWGIPKKAKVILFAGRLVANKGCHVVIDSLRKVLKKHKDTYLLVVGSKWYASEEETSYIKRLHRKSKAIKSHILFTSYVPIEEMPLYYAASDLFVCASQWKEPLARVHYEAMASSLPIITTQRGGNTEVIRQGINGLILRDYENSTALAFLINHLFSNPRQSRKLGDNGRILAERYYHFHRVAHDLLGIYEEVMNHRV
ncbi:glycosyltransferase family 4 protein [Ammoniphilus resinae]|uniref:Spore coat protein SA n=1 Tax=Ammoniphilus resinae TaxID=861532 RepID=A0ABS4GRU5_9BACL|nr:glycosyltransferase family 4 protein [Ammoniphilus resinae]MBP1932976.1 spore coat protein SA [Ammoniphilus resinae]